MNTQNKTLLSLALLGTPNTGITLTYIIAQMDEDDLATKFREGDYDFEYDDLIETGFYKQADEYMRMEIEKLCVPHQVIVAHQDWIEECDLDDNQSLIELIKDEFNTEYVEMDIDYNHQPDLKVEKMFFVGNDAPAPYKDTDCDTDTFQWVSVCDNKLLDLVA